MNAFRPQSVQISRADSRCSQQVQDECKNVLKIKMENDSLKYSFLPTTRPPMLISLQLESGQKNPAKQPTLHIWIYRVIYLIVHQEQGCCELGHSVLTILKNVCFSNFPRSQKAQNSYTIFFKEILFSNFIRIIELTF